MPAISICVLLLLGVVIDGLAGRAGYQFLDGHSHTAIPFEKHRDLIVISVQMNDSIRLRLVLDTGTRSLLLYGKKFRSLPSMATGRQVKVSGWGDPDGIDARLSYPNTVSLGTIRGEFLGIAVVDKGRMFPDATSIDGIIGYELFVRFAVEINYQTRMIHLYDRLPEAYASQFTALPLEINKARPQVTSEITMANNKTIKLKLLIDTGSSLGLVVFSSSQEGFSTGGPLRPIGRGLTGSVFGYELFVKELNVSTMSVKGVSTHLVDVPRHPDDQFTFSGSLGAGFLSEHVVIFDYPRSTLFLGSPSGG